MEPLQTIDNFTPKVEPYFVQPGMGPTVRLRVFWGDKEIAGLCYKPEEKPQNDDQLVELLKEVAGFIAWGEGPFTDRVGTELEV